MEVAADQDPFVHGDVGGDQVLVQERDAAWVERSAVKVPPCSVMITGTSPYSVRRRSSSRCCSRPSRSPAARSRPCSRRRHDDLAEARLGDLRRVAPGVVAVSLQHVLGLDPEGDEAEPDEPSGPYELPHRIASSHRGRRGRSGRGRTQ